MNRQKIKKNPKVLRKNQKVTAIVPKNRGVKTLKAYWMTQQTGKGRGLGRKGKVRHR